MSRFSIGSKTSAIDERRELAVPGDAAATLDFSVEHFIHCANEAMSKRGRFCVALSGGSTPKGIYRALALPQNRERLDWQQVLLFWSDERAVSPTDPDSNYCMAMDAGLKNLPLREDHIFRMHADQDIETAALAYEEQIVAHLPDRSFDLMMLGLGEDGHVASLFPNSAGINAKGQRVVANYIPQKDCWRMTLTFEQINGSRNIAGYVLGKSKAHALMEVLKGPYTPAHLPAQKVGTREHKCLWIADLEASREIQ